ncbi:DUF4395 domain-containing protein [Orlajensenia leifsoniae]|uniref:DUF4395 domain-containing protein n=1 Tax=Orlajensenia leifsoniae TaxID=2561933 RepID=A0A4Y9R296_9MICO|nr:DUF4395 domain-containing protein [Leifsonia flava]TFV98749.1 DUF4395 domain-containing protein [Leifsonia flava]
MTAENQTRRSASASASTAAAPTAAGTAAPQAPAGIDPRGPRFVATITAVILFIDVVLGLAGADLAALLLLAVVAATFAWTTIAGIRRHPFAIIFRRVVLPRLTPTSDREDPRPPTFAQGVGLFVTGVGVILGLLGIAPAVVIAAAFAFVAAFLNSAFGFCLGCQIYLLLQRLRPAAA